MTPVWAVDLSAERKVMYLPSDGGAEVEAKAVAAARLDVVGSESSERRLVQLEAGIARCDACFDLSVAALIDPFVLLKPHREAGVIVDFVYEYANDAACEASVLTREQLIGTRMLQRRVHLEPVGLFHAYVTVMETNEPLALDDFAQPSRRRGDPDRRFFDLRALRADELLVLTWRDVTERDRVDIENARLATIVRSSDDAIMSLDCDLRITSWNGAAERLYGYTSEEILGAASDVLIPADATSESRGLRELAAGGGMVQRYETRRVHRDGSLIEVAITAFAQTDPAGDPAGMTTITRDITGRARAWRTCRARGNTVNLVSGGRVIVPVCHVPVSGSLCRIRG
jgi:PAS domain S-box-containing protein